MLVCKMHSPSQTRHQIRIDRDEQRRQAGSRSVRNERSVRRRPNPQQIIEQRAAAGLVDGNTQQRRSNNGVRGGRMTRTMRQVPTAAAAGLQFAAAFQHIPVAHTLLQGDPGEIERIRQNELAAATAAVRTVRWRW
jgi:hypothetical protein